MGVERDDGDADVTEPEIRLCVPCGLREAIRGEVWGVAMCGPCMCAWESEVPYATDAYPYLPEGVGGRMSTKEDDAKRIAEMYRRTKAWTAQRKAVAA